MNLLKKVVILSCILQSCNNETPKTPINNQTLIAFEDTTKEYGWGYKNLNGQVIIEPQYSHVETDTFSNAIAFVFEKRYEMDDERHGYIAINKQNEFVLKPFIFDNGPDYLEEGLFRFVENGAIGAGGKMGFANLNGEKVIPARFTFVSPFFGGMAAFCYDCQKKYYGEHWKMEGRGGFIDKNGKEVIPVQFDDIISGFKDGKAEVIKNGVRMFINQKGEEVKN
jgi:WG containing repeat